MLWKLHKTWVDLISTLWPWGRSNGRLTWSKLSVSRKSYRWPWEEQKVFMHWGSLTKLQLENNNLKKINGVFFFLGRLDTSWPFYIVHELERGPHRASAPPLKLYLFRIYTLTSVWHCWASKMYLRSLVIVVKQPKSIRKWKWISVGQRESKQQRIRWGEATQQSQLCEHKTTRKNRSKCKLIQGTWKVTLLKHCALKCCSCQFEYICCQTIWNRSVLQY